MLLGALSAFVLIMQPPCVAVHGGKLNVEGDSTAIAISAALQRHGYVEQANCVIAMVERQGNEFVVRLVLLETVYRPALVVGGGGPFLVAVDQAATKLAEQVSFWQSCWDSHASQNVWRRTYSPQKYFALCDLIAVWLRP